MPQLPPPKRAKRKPKAQRKERTGYTYDWDLITNGEPHEFVSGVNFECEPESLVTYAYKKAAELGMARPKAEISEDRKTVIIQFEKGGKRAARKKAAPRRRNTNRK